jgi:Transposase
MFDEGTSVGLDVHARTVVAEAVDWSTGQVFSARLVPAHEEVIGWVRRLPAPAAVAYEAGPTGFGLARACQAAGIDCLVVAPSKLERPGGDRVKTDRRDARRLARLLHIGELPGVRVPSVAEEHARDLVRAPEDTRGSDAGPPPGLEVAAASGHRLRRRHRLESGPSSVAARPTVRCTGRSRTANRLRGGPGRGGGL